MNNRIIMGFVISIIGVIILTLGISFSFYDYITKGIEDNILSSKVVFLYSEVMGVGKGITIQNAMPVSDTQGKNLSGTQQCFDFQIINNISNLYDIPYEITIRKDKDSTLEDHMIKVYLTELQDVIEQEVLFDNFDALKQTEQIEEVKDIEKTIYQGKIAAKQDYYQKQFRLRIWIDGDQESVLDDSNSYSKETFTVMVNVYANGASVIAEEDNSAHN